MAEVYPNGYVDGLVRERDAAQARIAMLEVALWYWIDDYVTNEEWYDKEAAPKLRDLANEAGARGMSFIGVVEYAPDHRARTTLLGPHGGLAMKMLTLCAVAGENIDGYMISLIRYCREKGVDTKASIVMRMMDSQSDAEAKPQRSTSDGGGQPPRLTPETGAK